MGKEIKSRRELKVYNNASYLSLVYTAERRKVVPPNHVVEESISSSKISYLWLVETQRTPRVTPQCCSHKSTMKLLTQRRGSTPTVVCQ